MQQTLRTAVLLLAVAWSAPAAVAQNQPRQPQLPTVDLSGTVESVKRGYIQVAAGDVKIREPRTASADGTQTPARRPAETAGDDKKPEQFVVAVDPANTKVTVSGTADAKVLKPGMFVRFSGRVDKERKVIGELGEVEVFTPAADFKPTFDVKLPAPKFATDEPAPETLAFEAEGPIAALKAGELTAAFFDNQKVKVKLAKEAKVRFTTADYSQARSGDVIRVRGKLFRPGQVLADSVTISLAEREKKEKTMPADEFAP
jgi:hypothetical protein